MGLYGVFEGSEHEWNPQQLVILTINMVIIGKIPLSNNYYRWQHNYCKIRFPRLQRANKKHMASEDLTKLIKSIYFFLLFGNWQRHSHRNCIYLQFHTSLSPLSFIIYVSHRAPCTLFSEFLLCLSIKYGGRSWSMSQRKREKSCWAILRSWCVMLGPRALNLVSQQRLWGTARGDFLSTFAALCLCVCHCVSIYQGL